VGRGEILAVHLRMWRQFQKGGRREAGASGQEHGGCDAQAERGRERRVSDSELRGRKSREGKRERKTIVRGIVGGRKGEQSRKKVYISAKNRS